MSPNNPFGGPASDIAIGECQLGHRPPGPGDFIYKQIGIHICLRNTKVRRSRKRRGRIPINPHYPGCNFTLLRIQIRSVKTLRIILYVEFNTGLWDIKAHRSGRRSGRIPKTLPDCGCNSKLLLLQFYSVKALMLSLNGGIIYQ